jgi:hypothetical protein
MYKDSNKQKITEKLRHVRYRENGLCHRDGNPVVAGRKHCQRCLQVAASREQRRRSRIITKYGGACVCCGEDFIGFLSMDHIAGNGAEHRKKVPGNAIYTWLKANNYPPEFQVLCHNCNWYKGTKPACMCPYRVNKVG